MKKFSIRKLARIIGAETKALNDGSVTGVTTDSRTAKPGDCFFAIAGENFDGHDYVAGAFAKGAACAIVSKNKKFVGDCVLKVDDTIKALGDFAREYRRQANFKVIAITGSVGKTTTRQIVAHILSSRFPVFQSPENFNNNIGLPLTLLGAEPHHQIIIAELGANHPGEISQLTRIAQPDIALVTNVHPAHLEGFGDLQTIIEEKLSVSEGLRPGGTFIINGSSRQLVETCKAKAIKFTTFADQKCEIPGPDNPLTIEGTEIHLPLSGPGNIENALAAWSVCRLFGLTVEDFARAIKTLPPISMRTEILKTGSLTILNDCYNANPASMNNALEILTGYGSEKNRRRVFICGDMAELGQKAEYFHKQLGCKIAKTPVNLLITVGKLAQIAAQVAKTTSDNNLQIKSFEDTLSACNNLKDLIKDSDIILVKGSRTAKLETAVEKLKELFAKKTIKPKI